MYRFLASLFFSSWGILVLPLPQIIGSVLAVALDVWAMVADSHVVGGLRQSCTMKLTLTLTDSHVNHVNHDCDVPPPQVHENATRPLAIK